MLVPALMTYGGEAILKADVEVTDLVLEAAAAYVDQNEEMVLYYCMVEIGQMTNMREEKVAEDKKKL